MIPPLGTYPRIFALAATLILAACAASGGGGTMAISSIFNEDLSARQPRETTTGALGTQVAATGTRDVVFQGSGRRDRGGQTVSSFEPGEFTLNFENADIREVVHSVLGEALGENYAIDPNVSGSVTISSARPLARDDLIPMLEVVLQMNGATLVRDGPTYRVMLEGTGVAGTTDVGEARPGYGLTILPLRHVSAQTLISLIDGFGTRPGSVRAETSRNLLIVLGSSADRKAAIDTAMTFDADWMQDQTVAVLPLRHTRPETIIPELERIFASRQGSIGANLVQFIPMQRMRAVLAVSPQAGVIEDVRIWVRRLDVENPDLSANVQVYRVKYRDARTLAGILNSLFSGTGGPAVSAPSSQIEPGAEAVTTEGMTSGFGQGEDQDFQEDEDLVAQGEDGAPPSDTGVSPALAETPEPATNAPATGSARIQADVANNSLVIYADLETRTQIMKALESIDVPQLQVAINVTMAEIRLNDQLRYGIQYFLKSSTFGLGSDNGFATLFDGLNTTIGQSAPGFNFVLGSARNPDVIISAFDSITDVQVLSSPSLVVVENETARFQVGDQIPIVTRTVTSVEDPNAPVSNEVEYRDTGVILNIKPRIAENGTVTLEIGQEISNVASGGNSLTPTISTRTVKSQIAVVDGQTVLLGGLISEQGTRDRSGIPGLHRTPVIGGLFGSRSRTSNRTELIILIRPTVIRGSEDAQHVAQELRSRLWGLGASQAR